MSNMRWDIEDGTIKSVMSVNVTLEKSSALCQICQCQVCANMSPPKAILTSVYSLGPLMLGHSSTSSEPL